MIRGARFPKLGIRTLWHGSMGGLSGPIRVDFQKAGKFYDFGPAFYCADRMESARNQLFPYEIKKYENPAELPKDYIDPFLYELKADLAKFKSVDVSGMSWALFVAFNRGAFRQDECPEFHDSICSLLESIDIVTGPISDDKTYLVLGQFLKGNMTFTCMDETVKNANAGIQYAFRTQKSADNLKITRTERLSIRECLELARESRKDEPEKKHRENLIIKKYRREGMYIDELITEIKRKRIVFPKPDKKRKILRFMQ